MKRSLALRDSVCVRSLVGIAAKQDGINVDVPPRRTHAQFPHGAPVLGPSNDSCVRAMRKPGSAVEQCLIIAAHSSRTR